MAQAAAFRLDYHHSSWTHLASAAHLSIESVVPPRDNRWWRQMYHPSHTQNLTNMMHTSIDVAAHDRKVVCQWECLRGDASLTMRWALGTLRVPTASLEVLASLEGVPVTLGVWPCRSSCWGGHSVVVVSHVWTQGKGWKWWWWRTIGGSWSVVTHPSCIARWR